MFCVWFFRAFVFFAFPLLLPAFWWIKVNILRHCSGRTYEYLAWRVLLYPHLLYITRCVYDINFSLLTLDSCDTTRRTLLQRWRANCNIANTRVRCVLLNAQRRLKLCQHSRSLARWLARCSVIDSRDISALWTLPLALSEHLQHCPLTSPSLNPFHDGGS